MEGAPKNGDAHGVSRLDDRCQALVLVLSRWEASSLSIPKRLKFKSGLEGVAQVEVVMIGLISGLITKASVS
jgi:hypothetical protein